MDEAKMKIIARMTQPQVLRYMANQLKRQEYEDIEYTPAYIIAPGDLPIVLIAHADTVFKAPPKNIFYDQRWDVMWSPDGLGADDRAGIYAITEILESGLKPHVIITTNEEMGCIGAQKLVNRHKTMPFYAHFIIQLDRCGVNDSVYYELDNPEFEEFINSFGFKTATGSFSDISVICPAWGISGVNLSIGYESEHTEVEHLYGSALDSTIDKVKEILNSGINHKYEYIERVMPRFSMDMDIDQCDLCGRWFSPTNMIEIYDEKDIPYQLCPNCLEQINAGVDWCDECHKGYLLEDDTREKLQSSGKSYKCKACVEKENANGAV